MAKFWERLRSSAPLKGSFLFIVVALAAAAGALLPSPRACTEPYPSACPSPLADAERIAFDLQMRLLREAYPRAVEDDVILIGVTEETEARFHEPVALWHRHFAEVLHALAKAKPRAVGVDFVLPERTFDGIVPGLDLAMMRGMLDLKRSTALVYVQTVDSRGRLVPVQPNYRNIVTADNLGVDQQLRDPDSVSRWFGEMHSRDGDVVPTLVSQMLRGLNRASGEGYIDYSLGVPLQFVPIHSIREWDEDLLRKTFGGRIVLIGSLIGGPELHRDRLRALAGRERQHLRA